MGLWYIFPKVISQLPCLWCAFLVNDFSGFGHDAKSDMIVLVDTASLFFCFVIFEDCDPPPQISYSTYHKVCYGCSCRKKMSSLDKERQDLLQTIDALQEGKWL